MAHGIAAGTDWFKGEGVLHAHLPDGARTLCGVALEMLQTFGGAFEWLVHGVRCPACAMAARN